MFAKVKHLLAQWHMLEGRDTVVAGVSGGADSVCLLQILWKLQKVYGYHLVAVHINHGLRKETAMRDQRYVESLCASWQIPCKVFQTDIKVLAKEQGMSEEEAGRMFRYQCFADVAASKEHSVVAVAHHMQDQVETMLFRMARGTGISGLKGMVPVLKRQDMTVIRPLLCVKRQEIEEYLKSCGIAFCQDETNEQTIYQRNFIRHEIIPALCHVNEQAVEHLACLAQQAAQVDAYVQAETLRVYKELVVCQQQQGKYETLYQMPVEKVMQLPVLLQQELFRNVLKEASGSLKDITRQHITLALSCLQEKGAKVSLPYQLEVFHNYAHLLVGKVVSEKAKTETDLQKNCENLKNSFCFREYSYENGREIDKKNYTKTIDCGRIKGTLNVRYRQPGDRIVIDCAGREKSLKKFFVDEKIPQYQRDTIPLVCDGNYVIWIVGYRLSPAYYITENTQTALDIIYVDKE